MWYHGGAFEAKPLYCAATPGRRHMCTRTAKSIVFRQRSGGLPEVACQEAAASILGKASEPAIERRVASFNKVKKRVSSFLFVFVVVGRLVISSSRRVVSLHVPLSLSIPVSNVIDCLPINVSRSSGPVLCMCISVSVLCCSAVLCVLCCSAPLLPVSLLAALLFRVRRFNLSCRDEPATGQR